MLMACPEKFGNTVCKSGAPTVLMWRSENKSVEIVLHSAVLKNKKCSHQFVTGRGYSVVYKIPSGTTTEHFVFQGTQDKFAVQITRQWAIQRADILEISETDMQPSPKKAVRSIVTPPDYEEFNDVHASTPTFATVIKKYDVSYQDLVVFNSSISLPFEEECVLSKPDGVLYLKKGARKRHIVTIQVRSNVFFFVI